MSRTKKIPIVIKDVVKPVRMTTHQIFTHIEDYLNSLHGKSKETHGTYTRCLRSFKDYLIRLAAQKEPFTFTVADIEAYKQYLLTPREEKDITNGEVKIRSLTLVSVSQYLTAVRRLCNYLVESGVLEKNPAKRVAGGPRPSKHKRGFLPIHDLEILIDSIDGDTHEALRDRALLFLMIGCAVSELEITNMRCEDLHKVGKNWKISVRGKGKSIKDELLPVPDETLSHLQRYFDSRGDLKPSDPIFVSNSNRTKNGSLSIRSLREIIHLRLKNSGISLGSGDTKITPFSLRHTAGVLLAAHGASVEYVMERMRIRWRPTAMIYFQNIQKLGLETRPQAYRFIAIGGEILPPSSSHEGDVVTKDSQ